MNKPDMKVFSCKWVDDGEDPVIEVNVPGAIISTIFVVRLREV